MTGCHPYRFCALTDETELESPNKRLCELGHRCALIAFVDLRGNHQSTQSLSRARRLSASKWRDADMQQSSRTQRQGKLRVCRFQQLSAVRHCDSRNSASCSRSDIRRSVHARAPANAESAHCLLRVLLRAGYSRLTAGCFWLSNPHAQVKHEHLNMLLTAAERL